MKIFIEQEGIGADERTGVVPKEVEVL